MKFSIVIPVAPERNAEIVESLKGLDYPKKEFEVIVVRGKNPSENRNKGAKKAKGKIIAFLDDDAKLDKDYLKKAENFFSENNVDVVGGPQLTPKDDKTFARISAYSLASIFGGFSIRNRYKKSKINMNADEKSISSANLLCKKEVTKKIKFDPSLFPGEDPDFINKCKEKGFIIAYSPEIFVYHRRRPTLSGFIRQMFSYGKTRPKIRTKNMNIFFLVPSFFLIYLFLWVILSSFIIQSSITGFAVDTASEPGVLLFVGLPLLLYIVLNFLFSIAITMREKDLLALLILPFIFLVLHISYGAGIITGLVKRK